MGRHWNLYEKTWFQTQVVKILWDDTKHRWICETDRNDVITAQFVLSCSGPLHKPKLVVPGADKFKGHQFHTSRFVGFGTVATNPSLKSESRTRFIRSLDGTTTTPAATLSETSTNSPTRPSPSSAPAPPASSASLISASTPSISTSFNAPRVPSTRGTTGLLIRRGGKSIRSKRGGRSRGM